MVYKRTISDSFPPEHSAFLFGPRQTGKTTIIKNIKSLLSINLLETRQALEYGKNPGRLYGQVLGLQEKRGYVIIDEIQKVPSLLDEVQRCVDEFPEIHFLLTGSSARKLKRGAANLLGGRALYFTMHPLTAHELQDEFSIDHVLQYGSLPKISETLKKKNIPLAVRLLKSYVTSYLSEEIKAEALVRNFEGFQRFLDVAAHQYARDVNLSQLADQAMVSLQTVKGYYSILEDTLIGFFLYPWATSVRKELTKTPKFYFFDNGVTRALQGVVSVPATHQERGHLFEQWVVQELFRLNAYLEKGLHVHFWRTVGGAEVDIVLSRGKKLLLAIACTATPYPKPRDLSGLKSFREEYPKIPVYLCAPVSSRIHIQDGYIAIPPTELYEIIRGV